MLMLASFIGAIILYGKDFFSGWINVMYAALANGSDQYILLILVCSGAMIRLLEKSGAMLGFRNMISKYAKDEHRVMFFTWVLGIIVFIDDYLNALAVSSAMRGLSDEHKIPREHLAYTVNVGGACVCVLIPFSSWAAFGIGTFGEYGWTFSDYVHAIPFMFYPIVALLICLLLGLGVIPKAGDMKKAYDRVRNGGPALPDGDNQDELSSDVRPTTPLNFLIPMVALVIAMLYFDSDLIHGMLVALLAQGIMYIAQRIMTLGEFMENVLEGAYSMASVCFVVVLSFMMNTVNAEIGFSDYVISILNGVVPAALLPVIAFIMVALVAFATGSFWPLIVIVSPIFVPMALSLDVSAWLIIAAMMSGIAFGSQCCMYSDAVFMTAAGTGVDNVTQIRAIGPYILSGFVISCALFILFGFII
ncbi:Na+/H+ antiporter NhaC family protein [Colidextribacter sp. OB.20]|uniref:Na+/H+ antiporter NhaC family protein n=1 Tax=Colidextribacter sp. OB.20 TaxID=2304568 RepID=UPI0013695FB6|nr:Na+/H+ antiporter NhaC family protein [Colidextribacter sp. OB.20]